MAGTPSCADTSETGDPVAELFAVLGDVFTGLPEVEVVDCLGDADGVAIAAVDTQRTMLVEGQWCRPVDDLRGRFGIVDLPSITRVLTGARRRGEVRLRVVRTDDEPASMEIRCPTAGTTARFMFRRSAFLGSRPRLGNIAWDVEIEIDAEALVGHLKMAASGGFSPHLRLMTRRDVIVARVGDPSHHHIDIELAKGRTIGEMARIWPLREVLAVLGNAGRGGATVLMDICGRGGIRFRRWDEVSQWSWVVLGARER